MHTGSDRESSACEDFDSIDPLVRLYHADPPYRRADIRAALQRAVKPLLRAQAPDGGWWHVAQNPVSPRADQAVGAALSRRVGLPWDIGKLHQMSMGCDQRANRP